MTIRERENERRHRPRTVTPFTLMVDVVKDEPDASDGRLKARWVSQVREDPELLTEVLENSSDHQLILARRHVVRQQDRQQQADPTAEQRRAEAIALKVVGKQRLQFFATKVDGKAIGEMTKKEVGRHDAKDTALTTKHATRSRIWQLLGKRLTGRKKVKQVWDVDSFRTHISGHLGDAKKMKRLYS